MNIHMIYFTTEAEQLAFSLRTALEKGNDSLTIASGGRNTSLPYIPAALWTTGHFRTGEALVFIGAATIAVRSIAKYVRDAATDPAVVVVDEHGQYAVPILSGHVGEANRLAREIAEATGGSAVITAETAPEQVFSADAFAADNDLRVADGAAAKRFADALRSYGAGVLVLPGEMRDVVRIEGEVSPGIDVADSIPVANADAVCMITPYEKNDGLCRLIPRNLILGIACRKGTDAAEAVAFAEETLEDEHLSPLAVAGVACLDRSKGAAEALAERYGVPVIEEDAGRLLLKRAARDGMTLTIGAAPTVIHFRGDAAC